MTHAAPRLSYLRPRRDPEARTPGRRRPSRLLLAVLLSALACTQGCAALSNPVANGVPVRRLPPELLAESKENMQRTPLSLLRQPPPEAYKIGPEDVLGVWIEGVLGEKGQPPPIRIPETGGKQLPTLGFPIPVRSDGTIPLPLVPPIKVAGLTLEQAQEAIRKAYTTPPETAVLKAGERIIVTLQRPRESHILVIRQDSPTAGEGGAVGGTGARTTGFVLTFGGGTRGARRGTGYAIDLPAYENDVLNALARTGGLPGSDAVDEVIVERGSFAGDRGREDWLRALQDCPPCGRPPGVGAGGGQIIRIPLRYRPGQPPQIRPQDVVLQTGDIVFIEAREADVFYTAGLLPAGEYALPRDTDLDVVQAILRIGGPIDSGGLSTTNINGALIVPGFGFPSPSLVSVIRQTPDGGQVNIRVDINRALRDPRERLLIQPKDVLVLQEKPQEAFGRYVSEVVRLNFVWNFLRTSNALGTGTVNVP